MPELEQQAVKKRLHPLPGFCWMWMLGAIHLGSVGGLFGYAALFPDASTGEEMALGIAGLFYVLLAVIYGIFWHRFAVRRRLTRRLWHVGTGLILAGAGALLPIGIFGGTFVYLLTLAVWTQGHTRQFFDRA